MLNNLGLAAMSISDDDKAIDYYQRVLTLDNKNTYAMYSIALIYEYKEDWKQAMKYYKQLIEKEPDIKKSSLQQAGKR